MIISNLKDFREIRTENIELPSISIRMNISRKNYEGCQRLIEYLHENKIDEYVDFYPAIVTDLKDKDFVNVFTVEEFDEIKKEVSLIKKKIGWLKEELVSYPDLRNNVCVCDLYNSFVIDSDGEIYKCWELMGEKTNSIGNIKNIPITISNSKYYRNILDDPTLDEQCVNCEILPICNGGGCPIYRKDYHFKPTCENYKEMLKQQVIDTYLTLSDNIR